MKENDLFTMDSPLGKQKNDYLGSPIGVTRIDPAQSYSGTGSFLQEYINNSDLDAWNKIKKKIDYTFNHIDLALKPLNTETGFYNEIKIRLDRGQKLLFKPNLVSPFLGIVSGNVGATEARATEGRQAAKQGCCGLSLRLVSKCL